MFDISGYINLPNGVILQWCHIAKTSGGAKISAATFPISFPSKTIFAFAVAEDCTTSRDNYFYGYPVSPIARQSIKFSTWGEYGYLCFAVGY